MLNLLKQAKSGHYNLILEYIFCNTKFFPIVYMEDSYLQNDN